MERCNLDLSQSFQAIHRDGGGDHQQCIYLQKVFQDILLQSAQNDASDKWQ